MKRRREEEKAAFGALASEGGTHYAYREKHGDHYRTVTVKLGDAASREDLLDRRSKVKSDKYC